ncbi:helix-turn-helix domain-containing protein [Maritalea porphyrae]|uniref:helix-turn-helix domain-containing protein n=1 Tax=Maritalea porphyrae TaxID=880732 RepID=UPI0022AF763F|nr:helix-turn-helix domain-containing protein [Maritalea porphyrae]MCZ4270788.1 helix-turn-helix domain-containing protein [Maritalea porphyrae]
MNDVSMISEQEIPQEIRSRARAALLLPRQELASCMPIGIVRDTRGANLIAGNRYNNFSTSPYCALSWIIEGTCRMADNPNEKDPRLWPAFPKFAVSGPTTAPTLSWNDGDVYAITVGFLPDAWFALTGVSVKDIVDKNIDATELLSSEFQCCFDLFGANKDATQEFLKLQDILEPIWAQRRPSHAILPNGLVDWANRSLSQLATKGVGRSTRQLQRRIKQWTGLTQRELAAHGRGEELYKNYLEKRGQDDFSISQIAFENGYADQSHLGRDVKRITGLSPKQLDDLFDHEERFWFYRLLRDYY